MNPPKYGSKKYIKILNEGCGGSRDYWGEYDCDHKYDWPCEDCPIVEEKERFIGPIQPIPTFEQMLNELEAGTASKP